MEEQVRLLIIGAGKMGEYHGIAAQHSPCIHLVGVVSRTEKSASSLSQRLGAIPYSTDLESLVKETAANCCVIAVSHSYTAAILEQCLDLGLHCLVEKPVDLDPDTISRLASKAESLQKLVMVGVNRRFYQTIQKGLLSSVFNGGINAIHLQAPDYPGYFSLRGSLDNEVYNHWPIMNTIHGFDLLSLYGEGIREIVSAERERDTIVAILKGRNGALISFNYSEGSGTIHQWKLVISGPDVQYEFGPLEELKISYPFPGTLSESYTESSEFKQGIWEQMMYFGDAVQNQTPIQFPACNLEEHAKVVEVMNEIFTKQLVDKE